MTPSTNLRLDHAGGISAAPVESAIEDQHSVPRVDPVNVLALDSQVCFALAAASRSVIGIYRPILEPLGLTHPQYLVMLALWEVSPRTLSSISSALLLEPATLTPLLKRLEAAGLITRQRSKTDERALAVDLTDAGRDLRAQCEAIPAQVVERLGLSLAELERTRDALHRLVDAARPRPQSVTA